MEKNGKREELTGHILAKASALPELKADFTAQIMAQIEADAVARRAKMYEPLISGQAWRWIGITLSSMVLLVLSLSVAAFGSWPHVRFPNLFTSILMDFLSYNQLNYLPELFLAGLICFCWLVLDYCYARLKSS